MIEPSRKSRQLLLPRPAVLMAAGIALFGVGLIWPYSANPKANWSPQQAEEYAEASAAFHAAAHDHDSAEHDEHQIDYQAARQRYAAIRHELDAAIDRPRRTGLLLKLFGALLFLVSGVALMSHRK